MKNLRGVIPLTTKNEENIIDAFPEIIANLAKHRDQQRAVEEYLSENHDMQRGTLIELVANPKNITMLSDDEQKVFINAIYQITNDDRANPSNYFNAKEVNNIKKYKFKIEVPLSFPLQYEKVLSGSEQDYVTKLSFKSIAKHYNDNMWTYNFLTQRNPVKQKRKDGSLKLEPKVNKRSIREIKQLLLDNKYIPDTPITLNIMNDGNDELFYDEENWSLIIESASEIDILDGYHRILAVVEALEENPNLEGYLYLSIRNYDLGTARFYLGQHNSFNTFDKTHVRRLKNLQLSDKVIQEVESKSALKGRLASNTSVRLKFNEITNFAILSDTVDSTFSPKNAKDKIDISKILTFYLDYLFGSFEDEFINKVQETHAKSWINHHNTFVLYIVFAHALYEKYGKNIPEDEIPRMINAIDFERGTSEFDKILSSQGKVNSNQIKANIKKFAEQKANELLI